MHNFWQHICTSQAAASASCSHLPRLPPSFWICWPQLACSAPAAADQALNATHSWSVSQAANPGGQSLQDGQHAPLHSANWPQQQALTVPFSTVSASNNDRNISATALGCNGLCAAHSRGVSTLMRRRLHTAAAPVCSVKGNTLWMQPALLPCGWELGMSFQLPQWLCMHSNSCTSHFQQQLLFVTGTKAAHPNASNWTRNSNWHNQNQCNNSKESCTRQQLCTVQRRVLTGRQAKSATRETHTHTQRCGTTTLSVKSRPHHCHHTDPPPNVRTTDPQPCTCPWHSITTETSTQQSVSL